MRVRFLADFDDFQEGQVVDMRREEAMVYVQALAAEPVDRERATLDLSNVERRGEPK